MSSYPDGEFPSERVPRTYWVAAFVVRSLLKLLFRLRVTGEEHVPRRGPCIIASNHASYLDPPVLGASIRSRAVRFMARRTLFRRPGLGWFLRHSLVVPIDRDRGDVGALRRALELLREGAAIAIFPEGTRTPDGELQPGKGGVGFLVAYAGVPVIPVYVDGTFRAWPRHRKFPRLARIHVRIGPPIPPADLAACGHDYDAIAARIMSAIAALRPGAPQQTPT